MQVATDEGVVIKRDIGKLATDVKADAERPSKSHVSGQRTVTGSFKAAFSSALPRAIADTIYCHGLSFKLS